MNADLFGYVGTFLNTIMLGPQVYKTWKIKQTKDLSLATLIIFVIVCVFWLIYGIMNMALPVIITNTFVGIINLILINHKKLKNEF